MKPRYIVAFSLLILSIAGAVALIVTRANTSPVTQTTETVAETATPTPTLEPTASPSPSPTARPTPKPTPRPTIKPTPSPTPSPKPMTEVAEVYISGQISYRDGTQTQFGQGISNGEKKKIVDPIRWMQVSYANKGGKPALDMVVNLYLDDKLIKTATVTKLDPGQTSSITWEGIFPTEPNTTHSVAFAINENKAFEETDYGNNRYWIQYYRE